jgi:hypothetical protein
MVVNLFLVYNKKSLIFIAVKKSELKEIIKEEIFNVLNEVNIKDDIKSLLQDLKSKGLIKSGDIDGNSEKASGKFKITVYPTIDTSSNLSEFKKELSKFFDFLGTTDTGKKVYKFSNTLYGWIWNNEGSSVDIILMRKKPNV